MGKASLKFERADRRNAELSYSASGFKEKENDSGSWRQTGHSGGGSEDSFESKTYERTIITYGELKYSWDFGSSKQSGIHKFTGLAPGKGQKINATVEVTCTKTSIHQTRTDTRSRDKIPPDEDGKGGGWGPWSEWNEGSIRESSPNRGTISVGEASASLTVYTKPDEWHWSRIGVNQTIQSTLSASEWNDLIDQCKKYKRWENQSSNIYINVSEVSEGQDITATLYNQMANACGISTRVIGGSKGTIIRTNLFEELARAVSR